MYQLEEDFWFLVIASCYRNANDVHVDNDLEEKKQEINLLQKIY
jgi:hypothetical protein